jgi:hypothetical protein
VIAVLRAVEPSRSCHAQAPQKSGRRPAIPSPCYLVLRVREPLKEADQQCRRASPASARVDAGSRACAQIRWSFLRSSGGLQPAAACRCPPEVSMRPPVESEI